MEDRKKNLKQFPRYDENPTSSRHKIEDLVIQPTNERLKVQTKEDDVLMEEYFIDGWKIRVFDNRQFIKLFPEAQADLVKLGSSGIAVFTYILINLKQMQEQIVIIPSMFGDWYSTLEGCSDSNTRMICYRGVIDLLNHKFIFLKVGEGSYFININKFFNGNRTKIDWVDDINQKLKNNIFVPKKAVEYNSEYKETKT